MDATLIRDTTRTALALLVFSVIGASLLSGTFGLTAPSIERSELAAKLKLIAQTLPAGGYDNNPVTDARSLPADPRLGLKRPATAYLAYQGATPVGIALEVIAPDGYSGEIKLLVGVRADGRLSGVRVTGHRETPGLADYIEIGKSPWIGQFTDKSLASPTPDRWKVRKDGGSFDSMAGATITPRAIVKAVARALDYFEANKAALLPPRGA
jgi:Na+-translocating ferredoxin:NAD+ oxidoreductase subunit G